MPILLSHLNPVVVMVEHTVKSYWTAAADSRLALSCCKPGLVMDWALLTEFDFVIGSRSHLDPSKIA